MSSARGAITALVVAVVCANSSTAIAGDFGRPSLGVTVPFFVAAPAQASETDEEREMNDRLWRFFHAPRGDSGSEAKLSVTTASARGDYYAWLMHTSYASAQTRYATLGNDVAGDLEMLPRAFAAVCAVVELDRQRRIAAGALPDLEPKTATRISARRVANEALVAQFATALRARFEVYSYALDNLLVTVPDRQAMDVDAALAQLEDYVQRAERSRFCMDAPAGTRPPAEADLPARATPSPPVAPPVGQPLDLMSGAGAGS